MAQANGRTTRQRLDHQHVVLKRRLEASALVGYPFAPATASRATLRKALRSAEGRLPIAEIVSEKVSAANLWAVADFVLTRWKPAQNHAFITQDALTAGVAVSMRTVQRAVAGLQQAGLFGVITGTEGRATQFYPLFHEPSFTEFKRILGIVEANTALEPTPVRASPEDVRTAIPDLDVLIDALPPWVNPRKAVEAWSKPDPVRPLWAIPEWPAAGFSKLSWHYDAEHTPESEQTPEPANAKDLRLLDGALRTYAQKASHVLPLLSVTAGAEDLESSIKTLSVTELATLVPNANPERLPQTLDAAIYIAGRFDAETGTCVVPFAEIADGIGCSRAKVAPIVDLLRDAGLYAYVRSTKRNQSGTFMPLFHSRGIDVLEAAIAEAKGSLA